MSQRVARVAFGAADEREGIRELLGVGGGGWRPSGVKKIAGRNAWTGAAENGSELLTI
jgi:hypothetical protein